ncbi:MAG: prepilin-type N-terminal cleavage/methylation domain-containing protein, partial [Gammaproteobacteria bacterium]|nr:prepilin-type N-terminal cleavage/methylation domain-containing protein [Gammaproteobacteria bacterium]
MSRPIHSAGFSLLELLVVVFIIGILATMFTLSVGVLGDDSELGKETARLQALLNVAREDAVTQGRELGMRFYPDGYEFAIFEEDFIEYYDPGDETQSQSKWTVMGPGTLLKPRQMPEGIVIELEIEGREIILDAQEEPQNDSSD